MPLLDETSENAILKVGEKSPDFMLDAMNGEKWSLSDYIGNVVALLFYPQNETLMCNRQLCSVRDHWMDYLNTKAIIVGISPGTIEDHQKFTQRHHLPLPILADTDRKITKIYCQHWIMPVQLTRAIIVIDAKGIIRHRKIMLRAFRPSDKSVIASIYAARTDYFHRQFDSILSDSRDRNKAISD